MSPDSIQREAIRSLNDPVLSAKLISGEGLCFFYGHFHHSCSDELTCNIQPFLSLLRQTRTSNYSHRLTAGLDKHRTSNVVLTNSFVALFYIKNISKTNETFVFRDVSIELCQTSLHSCSSSFMTASLFRNDKCNIYFP